MRGALITLGLWACGGAAVPVGPPQVETLAAALTAAVSDCDERAWQAPDERCADVAVAWDASAEAAIGQSIAGDAVVLAAARVADDLDQLRRAHTHPEHPGELELLIGHLRESMPALRRALGEAGKPDRLETSAGCLDDAELALQARSAVDRDRRSLDNLRRTFTAYAVRQGGAAHLLRRRTLEAHGRVAAAQTTRRAERWATTCAVNDEATLRRVRNSTADSLAAVDAYVRVVRQVLDGGEADPSELDAAIAAWAASAKD